MAVSHRGAISFGLVYIPVGLYTATQDNDIHFNQLCREDGSRVKYKKVCTSCGKEISSKDIVKGFEYDKDKFVIMTDEDFEKAKSEKDKTIHILHFTDLNSIRPIYYDKTYHAVPEAGGDKAFELLRKAMKDENKVAVAKTVMGTKEKLLTLIPTDDGILIETMFFADEVKQVPKEPAHPELNEAELTMAKTLINTMVKDFEPSLYKDEYQFKLREIIEQKIAGKDIVASTPDVQVNVIDIKVDIFLSCEDLFERVQSSVNYHLIFLDIEFPNMNGVNLSKKIRLGMGDIRTQIIFISAKDSYAMELFSVQPFDFIVKPVKKERLYPCISKFIKYYANSSMFFTYTLENMKHKIAISEIIYIQSERKKLKLITSNGVIICYHKFSDAVTNEMKNDMVVVKRGLAVNINHIVDTDFETVVLSNGTKLKISDGYRNSVMDVLSDKIGGA